MNGGCRPFIAGPENALLRVLVGAVFSEPPSYNPITLCGPSGTGKSHILHGLVNRLRTLAPHRRVWYLSGADFARQYARAVELDDLANLRGKFIASHVLMVDGLQELETKPAAQQELLHVLDNALDRQSQLLFTCRQSNSDWSWMLAVLRSRLDGGLLIPVALPELSTRAEIVRQLAKQYGIELSDRKLQHITGSTCGPTGARETFGHLRSAVLRLAATESASEDEDSFVDHQVPGDPTESVRNVIKTVARDFELRMSELVGPSRRKTVVQARGVAIYLARSLLGLSFEQLGKYFGDRDHTTVLHAYHKISNSLSTDPVLKQTIDKVSSLLVPLHV